MPFQNFSRDAVRSPDPSLLSRRRALGSLAAGAIILVGSSTPASALFWRSRSKDTAATVNLDGLPAEWVALQGSNLKSYADYLGDLRLKHLTPRQVIEAHAKKRGTVWNSLPPKALWRGMVPTLKVIDRVARELEQPVAEIVSAYRSPAYNARCAGASRGSWHQANVAADVKFAARPSTVVQTVRALRTRGVFRGGVGRYSTFTHVDTRGQNADW